MKVQDAESEVEHSAMCSGESNVTVLIGGKYISCPVSLLSAYGISTVQREN